MTSGSSETHRAGLGLRRLPPTLHRASQRARHPPVRIGNKSGLYIAFDARTGKPLWHTVVGYGSVGGGIRWDAPLGHGAIYAGINNYAYSNPSQFPPRSGLWT